jgi:secreted trypsin-like serine protease
MKTLRNPIALLSLLLCACTPEGDGRATAGIIGGDEANNDPAVVLLVAVPADHATFETCTANVVAPDVLLTAAHCVDPKTHAGYSFGVFLGADATAYPSANTLVPKLVPVKSVHIHPDYHAMPPYHADIAVVVLDTPVTITPLPIGRAPLDPSITGTPARIVGYGEVVYKEYNAIKHEASTVIGGVDSDDTMTVGDVMHKSCIGDSGGPALVMLDGVNTILAIDAYTDVQGCLEPAHYTRTDLYTQFLDAYIPPPPAGEGGAGGAATASSTGTGGSGASTPAQNGCSIGASGDASLAATMAILFGACVMARRRRW